MTMQLFALFFAGVVALLWVVQFGHDYLRKRKKAGEYEWRQARSEVGHFASRDTSDPLGKSNVFLSKGA